jgi:hypothetical protein
VTTLNGIKIVSLGMPSGFEPSGLTIVPSGPDWLFMVSDNGGLAKTALPYASPASWISSAPTNNPDHSDDYESVTCMGGNPTLVMIGVEGFRTPPGGGPLTMPSVRQYHAHGTTSPGAFEPNTWILELPTPPTQANAGMEALTWVPSSAIPPIWGLSVDSTLPLFMAVQAVPDLINVYLMPTNFNESTQTLTCARQLAVQQPHWTAGGPAALISDLCYDDATGVLWILYDGGASADYLQACRLPTSGTGAGSLQLINEIQMPWLGCEGVTVNGNDLFFCTDDNKSSGSHDGVYVVPGFVSTFIHQ